ncbi:MAG TPA: replicative DNA helicase [Streptosporangiaceae bacterium]|nr:replicative DNA helicase [Streptosporangiaceae bacterium]
MSVAEIAPRGEGFERTPPNDIAAEQCVLGGMLLSKDAISDVLEVIRPEDHYRPAHQIVHEVILDLYARGEPADAITVAAELTKRGDIGRMGGAPYLHTLIASVPTAANAGYYARIVRERAILRRLVEVGTRIVQLGYSGDADADDLVDRAEAEVYGVTEKRVGEDYLPLSEIMPGALDEIEAIGSRGGALTGVPTGFADLDALTNGLHPGQMIVIAARPALGKALALDTPLPTPAGWTTMGAVQVGDRLLGADGAPVNVIAATHVMHGRRCYEVEFSTGEVIVADGRHQWVTWDLRTRKGSGCHPRPGSPSCPDDWPTRDSARSARISCGRGTRTQTREPRPVSLPPAQVGARRGRAAVAVQPDGSHADATSEHAAGGIARTTEEIAATLRVRGQRNHAIPAARPLVLPAADLPIEPYVLGYLLGAGDTRAGSRVGCDPRDREWLTDEFRSAGYRVTGPADGGFLDIAGIRRKWDALGLAAGKHIPDSYLRSSFAQRLVLAQGLVDSNGYVDGNGAYRFANAEKSLADGFSQLVATLGCAAMMNQVKCRIRAGQPDADSWEVVVPTALPLARLPRKALRARREWDREQVSRFIVDVRQVPSRPVRCVQVDSPDQLYLAGRGMIPTHNSTLALDLARAASVKSGLTAVIFSLEMSRNEITMRLLSAEARVPLHSMRTGQMGEEDWTRLARRMSEVVNAPLFIDDSPNMSMMEIRAKCRRLKQRQDLRLVVIDYLQLMSSPRRVENRQQEVSDMSRSLKLLAKELDVPVIAVAQLNRGPEQRTDKRPLLADLRESGCLTADTTLLRADTGAPVTLRELLDNGHQGVTVWSVDDRHRVVAAPVTHVFASGIKDVYRLRLASGREVKASGNHPFLTFAGWLPLENLAAGDRVAIPRRVPVPCSDGLGWTEGRIGLLAHLIGDGCVLRSQPVHCTSNDESSLDFVESAAAAEFGITPRRVARKTWRRSYLPVPGKRADGCCNPLLIWFRELGIENLRSCEKRIPAVLYSASDREIALFLRHLWATGGSSWAPGGDSPPQACFASASRQLADGLALLLARLEILARIRKVEKAGCKSSYHVTIADGPSLRAFCSRVGVHGHRGAAARQLLAALPVQESPLLQATAASDIYWDRIESVEPLGRRPVFDATVKGTHNFVADGVFAHNSIEQDSDVVILLHREDAYERESPRAGEADFIVAKHRNGPTATVTVAFQGHYSRFVDMAPV